jgi:hypothetical protein
MRIGCRHDVDILRRANVAVEASRDSADDQELDAFPIELCEDFADIELRQCAGDVSTQPPGT